jgi:hypothetical protein
VEVAGLQSRFETFRSFRARATQLLMSPFFTRSFSCGP